MRNKTIYKGAFVLLSSAAIALIVTSIAMPVFVPVGVPVGIACLGGAGAAFRVVFSSSTADAAEGELDLQEVSPPEVEGNTATQVPASVNNTQVNMFFIFGRSFRGTSRVSLNARPYAKNKQKG